MFQVPCTPVRCSILVPNSSVAKAVTFPVVLPHDHDSPRLRPPVLGTCNRGSTPVGRVLHQVGFQWLSSCQRAVIPWHSSRRSSRPCPHGREVARRGRLGIRRIVMPALRGERRRPDRLPVSYVHCFLGFSREARMDRGHQVAENLLTDRPHKSRFDIDVVNVIVRRSSVGRPQHHAIAVQRRPGPGFVGRRDKGANFGGAWTTMPQSRKEKIRTSWPAQKNSPAVPANRKGTACTFRWRWTQRAIFIAGPR